MSSPPSGFERFLTKLGSLTPDSKQLLLGFENRSDLAEKLVRRARRAPRELPEGFCLTDSVTAWSWPKLLIGGTACLLWNAVTWAFVPRIVGSLLAGEAATAGGIALAILVGLLFLAVAAAIGSITELTRWTRNAWKLRAGQVLVPRWPLRLDDPVRIRYRRPFRREVDLVGELHARLVCLERATLVEGTDRIDFDEYLCNEDLPVHKVAPDSPTAEAEWLIRLPRAGPASFRGRYNHLIWGVDVLLRIPGSVTGHSTFALAVAPEVPE